MGLNHIDARLEHQCNYGVLDPLLDPLFGGTPGEGVWGFGTPIPWDPGFETPNPRDPGIGVPGIGGNSSSSLSSICCSGGGPNTPILGVPFETPSGQDLLRRASI